MDGPERRLSRPRRPTRLSAPTQSAGSPRPRLTRLVPRPCRAARSLATIMPVEPSSLAYSIGALTADATNKSVEDALSGALRAVVVLLAADGAGLMLVDSTGERPVGARGTDERSQRAEAVQEQLGPGAVPAGVCQPPPGGDLGRGGGSVVDAGPGGAA